MTTKLNNGAEIKSAFEQLFGQLTEKDILENDAKVLMFRFLTIVDAKREELGWSRKDLAEKIATTPSYISQLFQGDKLINMTTLAKIQQAMDIQFDITQKKSYEERIESYPPILDGKGFWVYRPFEKSDYSNDDFMPLAV